MSDAIMMSQLAARVLLRASIHSEMDGAAAFEHGAVLPSSGECGNIVQLAIKIFKSN